MARRTACQEYCCAGSREASAMSEMAARKIAWVQLSRCPPLLAPAAQVIKATFLKGLPQLPSRAVKVQASASSSDVPVLAAAADEKKFLGVALFTWQKIVPLGLMFFWCVRCGALWPHLCCKHALTCSMLHSSTTPLPPFFDFFPLQHPVQLHHSA